MNEATEPIAMAVAVGIGPTELLVVALMALLLAGGIIVLLRCLFRD